MLKAFGDWLAWAPLWVIGLAVFGGLLAASMIGSKLRARRDRGQAEGRMTASEQGEQSLTVSSVMGLLALLVAFTFSMALERFDTRWTNVIDESNAIGTTYLRAQLLDEPHRARISQLLGDYTDARIALATARPGAGQRDLLEKSDRLIVELWRETVTAFPSVRNSPFSNSFLQSMNGVIDMDSKRKAGRGFHVPSAVFLALFLYQLVAAGLVSYSVTGNRRSRQAARVLFVLLGFMFLLIIDVDRPISGAVLESQEPMLQLQSFLKANPPGAFGPNGAPRP